MSSDVPTQDWRAEAQRLYDSNPAELARMHATRATRRDAPPAAPAVPLSPAVPVSPAEPAAPAMEVDPKLTELEDFLAAVLPPTAPVYFAVTLPHAGSDGRAVHHPCRSALELAQRLLSLDTGVHEVYFALAGYRQEWATVAGKRKQRCRENVAAVRAAWLDIDVGAEKAAAGKGYATQEDARTALDAFCAQLGIAPTYIVSSGRGLHVYWAFREPVAPAEWQGAASALKRACAAAELRADPVRTADSTSILRPPGTCNRKDPVTPLSVAVLSHGGLVDFGPFRAAVERLAGVASAAPAVTDSAASVAALPLRMVGAVVDNSALSAGLHEAHPYIRGLRQEQALALIDTACGVIPDAAWSEYDFWALTAIAGCVGLHKQDGFDRDKLIDLLWQHSRRPAQYAGIDREEICAKFDDADLHGCSIGKLFEAAEQHGWHAAAALPAPPAAPAAPGVPFAPAVQITNAPTLERYLTDAYVLVRRGEGEYFDKRRRLCLKPGAVSRVEGHLTSAGGKSADLILRASPLTHRVDFLGFNPAAGEVYTEDGYAYANLHSPVAEEIQPTDAEALLIEDFLDYLFPRPEDQTFKQYYRQFLAHVVQRPAVKIATALLFVGGFGVGKNTAAFDIPSLIVGRRNAQVVSNKVLNSQFSDQLARTHLVYLDEVHCNGSWQSQEQSNNLKSIVSDPQLVVHPKGYPAYTMRNRLVVCGSSNYDDAMFLQANDRRWAVHEVNPVRGYTPEQHRKYFNVVHRFLRSERAAGALRWIFGRVDLAGFDAQNPPPVTAAKARMIEASLSPLEAEILELFNASEFPLDRDLFSMEWLKSALSGRVPGLDRISDQRIAQVLRAAPVGAVKLPGQKRLKVRRPNTFTGSKFPIDLSGKFRLWALRRADEWRLASEGAMSSHIETGAAPLREVTSEDATEPTATEPTATDGDAQSPIVLPLRRAAQCATAGEC